VSIRKDEFQAVPDEQGHFGPYGGRFVSETLMSALDELSALYGKLSQDANFVKEFDYDLAHYVGYCWSKPCRYGKTSFKLSLMNKAILAPMAAGLYQKPS